MCNIIDLDFYRYLRKTPDHKLTEMTETVFEYFRQNEDNREVIEEYLKDTKVINIMKEVKRRFGIHNYLFLEYIKLINYKYLALDTRGLYR